MLRLPNDTDVNAETLQAYLARQHGASDTAAVLQAIADATGVLADRLAAGRLRGPGEVVGTNESGDKQKALDVGAHLHMVEVLRAVGVRQLLSEEAEEIILLNPEARSTLPSTPSTGPAVSEQALRSGPCSRSCLHRTRVFCARADP